MYGAQADHYFNQGRYQLAAKYYALTQKSFEEITLKLIRKVRPPSKRTGGTLCIGAHPDGLCCRFCLARRPAQNEGEALKTFLVNKLDTFRKEDATQVTLLCTWLVEIYLNKLSDARENKREDEYKALQEEFHDFLSTDVVKVRCAPDASRPRKHASHSCLERKPFIPSPLPPDLQSRLNHQTTYNLIASHGQTEEMLFFAKLVGDYERVIQHYIQSGQYLEALATMRQQSRVEVYYRFSPALMEKIPYETVTAWVSERSLDPKQLIPAIMKYDGSRVSRIQDVRQRGCPPGRERGAS